MPRSRESADSLTSTRAFNGAPDLNSALATEGWRKAIKIENAIADQLERALELKKIKSQKALAMQWHQVAMSMPPTTMSLVMSRLKRPETRELAMRQSMTRTNTLPSLQFVNTTPWARQLAITSYAPPLVLKPLPRGATRHQAAAGSLRTPWR